MKGMHIYIEKLTVKLFKDINDLESLIVFFDSLNPYEIPDCINRNRLATRVDSID